MSANKRLRANSSKPSASASLHVRFLYQCNFCSHALLIAKMKLSYSGLSGNEHWVPSFAHNAVLDAGKILVAVTHNARPTMCTVWRRCHRTGMV
jgi:hypothetical protein